LEWNDLLMRASPQSRPRLVSSEPDLPRLIVPKRYVDERGWFSETFHEQRLRDTGIACRFVQDNRSQSKHVGTLRGLHFQLPPAAQAKLVGVLRGRILDVAVDIRSGSPTYGRYVSAELTSKDGRQLYVPVGFAHGFCTLEDDVEVMYKVSDHYAPALDGGIRWNDSDIDFPWPFAASDIVVSEKDGRLTPLKDFVSPFAYDGHPLMPLALPPPYPPPHAGRAGRGQAEELP
jgi:dTDP-4-dehydrorhamnose 3,5-epimerase